MRGCVFEREREIETERGRQGDREEYGVWYKKKEGSHRRETERVERTLPFLTLLRTPE